jgi:hypothetical protein
MGGEIMRGGRNGEYDGRFWRGVMTGWSKGRRENRIMERYALRSYKQCFIMIYYAVAPQNSLPGDRCLSTLT